MSPAQSSRIREVIRLVADVATTLLVAILIGTFAWMKGIDRDVVRIDTNQKIVMGTVEKMTSSVSELAETTSRLAERVSKLEGKEEGRRENR